MEPDRDLPSPVVLTPRRTIVAILLLALLLRTLAFSPYAFHHPDEIFQYLEQAHRLAFGSGLVPWEYRLGMRSWLVPLLLAGPMWLGDRLWPGSILYVVLARMLAAIIALAILPAVWWLGARLSRLHALVALAVFAVWFETVYFSVHVLTETLSVALFFPAAALLKPGATARRLAAGGAALALATVFRFHYAPAFAVFLLVLFGRHWRDWGWLLAGATLMLAANGLVDLAMGQWPYSWVVENFRQNILENGAARFGIDGPRTYEWMIRKEWGWAFVPILVLAGIGVRRFPALAGAALVNLVVLQLIGHKEYRFLLLTTQIVIFLAAIGSVDATQWWKPSRKLPRRISGAILVAAWSLTSALLALAPAYTQWRNFEGGPRLEHLAAARPICGLMLISDPSAYGASGGQTFLHGPTPLYTYNPADPNLRRDLSSLAHAFDAIIASPGQTALPPEYRPVTCSGSDTQRLCLSFRNGGCTRDSLSDRASIQHVIETNGR